MSVSAPCLGAGLRRLSKGSKEAGVAGGKA